jgi:hypothetical protein
MYDAPVTPAQVVRCGKVGAAVPTLEGGRPTRVAVKSFQGFLADACSAAT